MITNVKMATNEFDVTVKALATNGDNLMKAILKSLSSTEAILLKVGLSLYGPPKV